MGFAGMSRSGTATDLKFEPAGNAIAGDAFVGEAMIRKLYFQVAVLLWPLL